MRLPVSKLIPWKPDQVKDDELRQYLKQLVFAIQQFWTDIAKTLNLVLPVRIAVREDYATNGETIIGVVDTSSPRTIMLSNRDCRPEFSIIIKDESGGAGTNHITVITEGNQLIDGQSSRVINTDYGVLRLYSDGKNWYSW